MQSRALRPQNPALGPEVATMEVSATGSHQLLFHQCCASWVGWGLQASGFPNTKYQNTPENLFQAPNMSPTFGFEAPSSQAFTKRHHYHPAGGGALRNTSWEGSGVVSKSKAWPNRGCIDPSWGWRRAPCVRQALGLDNLQDWGLCGWQLPLEEVI